VNLKTDEGRAMSTEATLTHHLQALYEGVEAVLSDYTEESVLFTPDGPVRGLAGIRAFFENFINNSPAELFQAVTLVRQDIVGEAAYIIWKAEPYVSFATDTFVIRNGKIVFQTYAAVVQAG
jgi:ketosteroid isomerase-like protein